MEYHCNDCLNRYVGLVDINNTKAIVISPECLEREKAAAQKEIVEEMQRRVLGMITTWGKA